VPYAGEGSGRLKAYIKFLQNIPRRGRSKCGPHQDRDWRLASSTMPSRRLAASSSIIRVDGMAALDSAYGTPQELAGSEGRDRQCVQASAGHGGLGRKPARRVEADFALAATSSSGCRPTPKW
jgi:hypothetical protein